MAKKKKKSSGAKSAHKKRGGFAKGARAPFAYIERKFKHYKKLFFERENLPKAKGGPGTTK